MGLFQNHMMAAAAAATADTGYTIDNSCRFNINDTAYLARDVATTLSNKFTYSFWVKRCTFGTYQYIVTWRDGSGAGSPYGMIQFNNDDTLSPFEYDTASSANYAVYTVTDAVFRDPSAWYHIVVNFDYTRSTSDRVRVYANGTLQTFGTNENSASAGTPQSQATGSDGNFLGVAKLYNASTQMGDFYMAEVHLVSDAALAASEFGETNSNGVWVPKEYSGSYGDEGHFLDFESSGDLGNDVSGNNNDFSVTNLAATDQSTDTCTNNFATINSLNTHTSINLSEGNLKATGASSSSWVAGAGTIGITKGFPCYWEAKATTSTRLYFGLSRLEEADPVTSTPSAFEGTSVTDYMWRATTANTIFYRGSNLGATISAVSTGDIMACSVDSSGIVKFYNNGSVIYTFSQALIDGFFYFPIFALNNYSSTETIEANFGNPAFSISSGNTDANGYGNFEHAPPANHYALNTKNLSEFG